MENLTIQDIINKTVPYLTEKGVPNPRLEADLMLAHILDWPRVKLYSQWDRSLEPKEVQRYREILIKRVQGTPLAYLTGKKAFLSWDFNVNHAVLIPRPETELLVEAAVDRLKNRSEIQGVDVGTGSGVIAISLAKLLPGSTWHAVDISKEAVAVATENANLLGVSPQITFLTGDLLEPVIPMTSPSKFDLIISNPPYIPSDEINTLQAEVQQEPWTALDGGADGLTFYRRLIPQAVKILAGDGYIILEHGFNQRPELEALMAQAGLACQSIPDLSGWDRVLIGHQKNHA